MKPSRLDILGVQFNLFNQQEVINAVKNYNFESKNYICFPSTDTIALADKNKYLQKILNNSFLTLIDGKFTEIIARLKGKKAKVVSAYNLLNKLLTTDLTHYFYGLNEKDLAILKTKIEEKYPKARVLGYKSPPFVQIDEIKNNSIIESDIKEINHLKPNLIWLGISTPKQDYLAHRYINQLDQGLIVCVGAVLLYVAELVNPGPPWVKKMGIKWLYRLLQEPKRLWKHTFSTTFLFFRLLVKNGFHSKHI